MTLERARFWAEKVWSNVVGAEALSDDDLLKMCEWSNSGECNGLWYALARLHGHHGTIAEAAAYIDLRVNGRPH